jgi:predicted NUDIX family NTP pyrophosphohydrolase
LLSKVAKISAGLLLYRRRNERIEVLLVHPGGPFWRSKDAGAWSIPKGEIDDGEELLAGARREFLEETGIEPTGPFIALGSARLKSGKQVFAWAFEGDCDPLAIKSNDFEIEWPPRSGKLKRFPEVDRAEFFELDEARNKLNPAQTAFLTELVAALG